MNHEVAGYKYNSEQSNDLRTELNFRINGGHVNQILT